MPGFAWISFAGILLALVALATVAGMETGIQAGDRIMVRDATGEWLRRRARGGTDQGDTFPVVWACREEEWVAAAEQHREPDATPWPADDVRVTDGSLSGDAN